MTDNMKKFLEEASKNGELQDALMKANNDYFQALIDASKEQGIPLTNEDIALLLQADKNHDGRISEEEFETLKSEELKAGEAGDDEVKSVAGGAYSKKYGSSVVNYYYESDCLCVFGGGGTGDGFQKTCACVFAGCGELTDRGKEAAAQGYIMDYNTEHKFKYAGSSSAPVAMWCALAGQSQ